MYQKGVRCIITTKVISFLRVKSLGVCHFLFTPPFHPLKDIAVKSISSFAMIKHQPSLASQLRTSCPAVLLELLVQNEQDCEGAASNRKPIWTPSALGKQSQIQHGAIEPGLGSHPLSQKTRAMPQDTNDTHIVINSNRVQKCRCVQN